MKYYVILVVLASLVALSSAATFQCKSEFDHLVGDSGSLVVTRSLKTCGFTAQVDSKFFGIRTNNLRLYEGEYLTISPNSGASNINISGPVKESYLLFAMQEVRIEFNLSKLDNSTMVIDFFENLNQIPINGDQASKLWIKASGTNSYNLNIVMNYPDTKHLEISGSNDVFGHYLINNSSLIPITAADNKTISVKTTPVLGYFSKTFTDKEEQSHEISGPDASKIVDGYKIVNLFETTMSGQSHFDVDFSNFLDIVDTFDELVLYDGIQTLKITRFTAREYNQRKPIISFVGKRLAVIYTSPHKDKPRAMFKLTVKSKATGGLVDTYQTLALPDKGNIRYTLRSQDSDLNSALEIKGKLTGADMKLTNIHNKAIVIKGGMFLPPVISFGKSSQDIDVELNVTSKVSATLNYKQENDCSGTIFGDAGTISLAGGNKTCFWLIGSKSSVEINYHDLRNPASCIEVYDLTLEKPIMKSCNLEQTKIYPPIVVGPAYLKIAMASNSSRFDATISPPSFSRVQTSVGTQITYTSTGFPAYYSWSADEDSFDVNAKDKSMILSVGDIDIRTGEKFMVNDVEISSVNYLALGDMDVSKKVNKIVVERSLATNDFSLRRGYSLVTNQFQSIISADMSKNSILTPKGQTSLLLKISANQMERLSYNIAGNNTNTYDMRVIDARSLLGSPIADGDKLKGNTTSNTLLISLVTKGKGTTLPEFNVTYHKIACNETIDHVCDQKTRCVPAEKLCKGKSYCLDGSDFKVPCSNGPSPKPNIITKSGYSGLTVFVLSVLMFCFGIMATIYGPDLYKSAENRFRSGQYTTFSSTE